MDEKDPNVVNKPDKPIDTTPINDTETIAPTMIDDMEERLEKKRDLSAIIPKFEEEDNNANSLEIISKDNELKSDGAVSLETINSEGVITVNETAVLPEQIDIEQRKIEAQRRKNQHSKRQKKKVNLTAQKIQNWTALVVLVIMISLGGLIYYIFNRSTAEDFEPINLTIELGDKLPIRTSSYVKPGVGKEVDELQYALDLSEVNESEPGTYNFTVTYNKIEKTGKIIIQDTKEPELEVRELIISEGTSYTAASFVESCSDPSGCNYSFQDSATPTKYTSPGSYVVYVVASDAFNNSTTKQASLIIETEGTLRKYEKNVPYDNSLGYEVSETYDLRFLNNTENAILIIGTHTTVHQYQDKSRYEKDQQTYAGEANYTFDDASMKIIYTQTNLTFVGSNYSRLSDVESYLTREGFSYVK